MYAGFYTSRKSADWLGAHQKFNRAAYAAVKDVLHDDIRGLPAQKQLTTFPGIKLINSFEGYNGPDGIKVKSPAQDEPWHYYDPFDDDDVKIFELINMHLGELTEALIADNQAKAAFEASWLAHTLTDGMTPAHHYPYEEEMVAKIGRGNDERTSKSKKLIATGENVFDTIRRNWQIHGGKGLLTTHIHFEAGINSAIITHRIVGGRPSDVELDFAREKGLVEVFKRSAEQIARMNLYGRFYTKGWNRKLARRIRYELSPIIVRTIAIAWYLAMEQAANA